jgi:DNA repair exonuclease SbcCD ATPase subunit
LAFHAFRQFTNCFCSSKRTLTICRVDQVPKFTRELNASQADLDENRRKLSHLEAANSELQREKKGLTSDAAHVNVKSEQVQSNQALERRSHHNTLILVEQPLQHAKEDLKARDLGKADHVKQIRILQADVESLKDELAQTQSKLPRKSRKLDESLEGYHELPLQI